MRHLSDDRYRNHGSRTNIGIEASLPSISESLLDLTKLQLELVMVSLLSFQGRFDIVKGFPIVGKVNFILYLDITIVVYKARAICNKVLLSVGWAYRARSTQTTVCRDGYSQSPSMIFHDHR
nr:ASN_HP1_G0046630.mRNA.1.CDS.1 [Saccharomyces cerevisiae]